MGDKSNPYSMEVNGHRVLKTVVNLSEVHHTQQPLDVPLEGEEAELKTSGVSTVGVCTKCGMLKEVKDNSLGELFEQVVSCEKCQSTYSEKEINERVQSALDS